MLSLRDLLKTDEPYLVKYLNNPNVVRYLSSKIPQPYTSEDAKWWLQVGSKENAMVKAVQWNNEFCGVIGIYTQAFEYAHAAEIGYWLAEPFWNRGIATEAIKAFSKLIFTTTNLKRLYNPVTTKNIASVRVMEKAGYQLEGTLKDSVCHHNELFDEKLFALLRD